MSSELRIASGERVIHDGTEYLITRLVDFKQVILPANAALNNMLLSLSWSLKHLPHQKKDRRLHPLRPCRQFPNINGTRPWRK